VNDEVVFDFEVDRSAPIEWDELTPVFFHLGIKRSFEIQTTHWAIKDGDLDAVLARVYPSIGGEFVSAMPAERKITFAPNVFKVPEGDVEPDLVAVMMPYAGFDGTYLAIKDACAEAGLRHGRADSLWDDSVLIQDIFSLIFRASIVVVDFTGKNPNVMYETGIAHTLGKHVVPITQSQDDVPFDLRHHRYLRYLPNNEGFEKLAEELASRLKTLAGAK
jgi:hypothetical protein